MLYFAFGSNLNQKQMKKRCKDSKYIGCYSLKKYNHWEIWNYVFLIISDNLDYGLWFLIMDHGSRLYMAASTLYPYQRLCKSITIAPRVSEIIK